MSEATFEEMKCAPFKTYEDIPPLTREYIVYVSGEKNLESVSLEDINGFMSMLYQYEMHRRDEYEDGWVM